MHYIQYVLHFEIISGPKQMMYCIQTYTASGAPHIVTWTKQTWIKHQCTLVVGEHPAAMREEHVGELHQAPAHHTRGLHICRPRVLDTTGNKYSNLKGVSHEN